MNRRERADLDRHITSGEGDPSDWLRGEGKAPDPMVSVSVHWCDKIAAQLDQDRPRWIVEWCRDAYAREAMNHAPDSVAHVRNLNNARFSVQREQIETIIRAAIAAGVVKEVK